MTTITLARPELQKKGEQMFRGMLERPTTSPHLNALRPLGPLFGGEEQSVQLAPEQAAPIKEWHDAYAHMNGEHLLKFDEGATTPA